MNTIEIPPFIATIYDMDRRRVYHNSNHLIDMFKYIQKHTNKDISKELYYAVLFHDIVYDLNRDDNEEESVKAWLSYIEDQHKLKSTVDTDKVSYMIMATKYPVNFDIDDKDTQLLLHADWNVLESNENKLNKYAEDIRQEYINFVGTDKGYYKKRVVFLNNTPKQYHNSVKYLINTLYSEIISRSQRKEPITEIEQRTYSSPNTEISIECYKIYTDILYHMNKALIVNSKPDIQRRIDQMETLKHDMIVSIYRDGPINYNTKRLEALYTTVTSTIQYFKLIVQ